jgi:hypothetical protein
LVADRAVQGDGVPSKDVAGQPTLLVGVLQKEVADCVEHEAANLVDGPGLLGRFVLEGDQNDEALLRPEGVRQSCGGYGSCSAGTVGIQRQGLDVGIPGRQGQCPIDLDALEADLSACQQVLRRVGCEVERESLCGGLKKVEEVTLLVIVLVHNLQLSLDLHFLFDVVPDRGR